MNYYTYVEYLLKNYNELVQEIKDIKELIEEDYYDVVNSTLNDYEEREVIEEINYKRFQGEVVKTSHIKDKTPVIAMIYKEVAKKRQREGNCELKKVISINERELKKLNKAMDRLPSIKREILSELYFEGRSYRQVSFKFSISESTLSRYRKSAIEYIAASFSVEALV